MKKAFLLALPLALLAGCASAPGQTTVARNCQDNCSNHEDGYQWAQSANLVDAAPCNGPYPEAFIDGCRDGVEDLYQLRRATRPL
ncbi:MAG TPA: hypothetical protein VGE22_20485 [Solimonas sp.]